NRLTQKPAVNAQINAGYETGGSVAGKENRGANQFTRLAEASHRRMAQDGPRAIRRRTILMEEQSAILFRWEKSGRNRIHAHAFACPFTREKLCEAQHGGFCGRVGNDPR